MAYVGIYEYPITTYYAYKLMVGWYSKLKVNGHHHNSVCRRGRGGGGHSVSIFNITIFLQQQNNSDIGNLKLVTVWDGNIVNSQCYGFHKQGHLAFTFPDNNNNCQHQGKWHGKRHNFFQVSVCFSPD